MAYPNTQGPTDLPTGIRSTYTTRGTSTATATTTTTESDFPEPGESVDGDLSFPNIEPDTNSAFVPTEQTLEPSTEETTSISETTPEVVSIPVDIGTTIIPVITEEPTETTPLVGEETTTTEPFPDPSLVFPTLVGDTEEEETTGSVLPTDEDNPPAPEDFSIAQYASTRKEMLEQTKNKITLVFPDQVEIEATVATVAVDMGNQPENEFPSPLSIISTTVEQTTGMNRSLRE